MSTHGVDVVGGESHRGDAGIVATDPVTPTGLISGIRASAARSVTTCFYRPTCAREDLGDGQAVLMLREEERAKKR